MAGPSAASTIHEPASGIAAKRTDTIYFDWRWSDSQYASRVFFSQSADPADPSWYGHPKYATATLYDSNATIDFAKLGGGIPAGVWYWRLCSKSIYGEDDKCYLEPEIRQIAFADVPQCQDRQDNDGDGWTDSSGYMADPGCLDDPNGNNEAAIAPACRDKQDNDGDFRRDLDDPGCVGDPNSATEVEACRDGGDNDGDGKVDAADPGCLEEAGRTSEADPAPRVSRTSLTLSPRARCGLAVNLGVAPTLNGYTKRLFPFKRRAEVTLRGLSGRARGLTRKRALFPSRLGHGYVFTWRALRPGRYAVWATYPGDAWRVSSTSVPRIVRLMARHCVRS